MSTTVARGPQTAEIKVPISPDPVVYVVQNGRIVADRIVITGNNASVIIEKGQLFLEESIPVPIENLAKISEETVIVGNDKVWEPPPTSQGEASPHDIQLTGEPIANEQPRIKRKYNKKEVTDEAADSDEE